MINFLLATLLIVSNVLDGDTLKLSNGVKVRLSEIDSPELKQQFGPESKKFVELRVLNKKVKLVSKGQDYYKRTLGLIYIRNVELNKILVEEGYAWSYNSKRFKPLELSAKSKKLGLWALPNPIEPKVYRKNARTR